MLLTSLDLAGKTGARFVDLSDPADVSCADHDFFDGDHPTAVPRPLRRARGRALRDG